MQLEKKRVVLPEVSACLCYGLSSAARISEQLGIEKTFVKVTYNGADSSNENKSASFGPGGSLQRATNSAIGVAPLILEDSKALKAITRM